MKTYLVRFRESLHTEVRVKARNKDDAEDRARKILEKPDGREGQITFEESGDTELMSITEEVV